MKQKYSVLAVEIIALVLFSIIVFVAPFPKTVVFWFSYVFSIIALAAQVGFLHVAFQGGTSVRSKFYGYPIFHIGIIYLVVQLALALIFMIIGQLVPLWIPFLLYMIVLCLAAVGLIAADNVRDSVILVEEKQAANTGAMRMLRRTAEAMQSTYPEMKEVAEQLRYSDPVSTQASAPYEQQLQAMLETIPQTADEAGRVRVKNQIMEVLAQRNAVCKSSKTR